MADFDDWVDMCIWVERFTPADSRFLTPFDSHSFTWRTGRPQVVSRKDIPQDAEGIAQWHTRLQDVYRGPAGDPARSHVSLAEMGEEALLELAARYDADYVLTRSRPILRLPLMSSNPTYAVYKLNPTP